MKSNRRDSVIDTARGIASILMVIGHLGMKSAIVQFIYSFHMPLFFLISGMTAGGGGKESLYTYINKRVRRLLVPYILFAFIYSTPGIREYLFSILGCRQGLAEASSFTPLWFLPCIFVADILFQLILRYVILPGKKNTSIFMGGGVSLICSLVGIILTRHFPYAEWIPFSANIALISIPFVFVGYWLSQSGIYTDIRNTPLLIKILVVFFLMIFPLLLYRFNLPPSVTEGFNHVELSIGSCGNYLFFMVNAICGSMGIIVLATIADCTYLRKVGQSTLTCLGTHGIIISVVTVIISNICDISWAIYIVSLGLVLIAIIPIQFLFQKYLPNLVGK